MGHPRHSDRARTSRRARACNPCMRTTCPSNLRLVPVPQSGCAGGTRTTRCSRSAIATSDGKCGGKVVQPHSRRGGNRLPAATIKPAAAHPSHTSAGARCRQANGSRCDNTPGNKIVGSEPGSSCHEVANFYQLGDDSSRASTGRPAHNAGKHVAGKRQGCGKVFQNAVAGRRCQIQFDTWAGPFCSEKCMNFPQYQRCIGPSYKCNVSR